MMIYRNTKGISFVEIIVSVAIISIIILGGAQAIKYVMHAMAKDRQQIKANHFAQMIIEELKVKCVPETFLKLKETNTTNDWEGNPPRKFPNLRGDVDIKDLQSDGTREVVVTISFINWLDENNNPKESEYHITLVKNTGLQPQGIIAGRVVNYVTNRGIPNAEVSAPSIKIDGIPRTCTTREDGSFTLTGIKVGIDIPVTIKKLGSRPNDMNYSPGYYFDPELIDPVTMEVDNSNPKPYENWNSRNDSLSWSKKFNVQNNVVTDITDIIGPVYLCPMAIVRGWVREDKDVETSGIGKILVYFGNSGNFNSGVLDRNFRNSMHPYYTMDEIHGNGNTNNAMAYLGDSAISIRSYGVYYGNYYATTADENKTYTYAVEGKNITFDMKKGDFVFFNIRPGNNTESYYRYLKILGRPGSSPTTKRTDPNFEWGYLRSYFSPSGRNPRLIVRATNCFDTRDNSSTFPDIGPLFNEAIDHHDPLPVTATATPTDPWSGYKYYYYGNCPHTHHNFNPVALAIGGDAINIPSHCGVNFDQRGWNNYETILNLNPDKLSTCYVARRRGGIKGRIIDAHTGSTIEGITVRSKSWADTSQYVSYIWTRYFRDNCPQVTTDSNGEFELNNIFGMEQQYFVTGRPSALLPIWDPHVDDFKVACNSDISIQDYAVLRITDDRALKQYVPRLIRPYEYGVFEHNAAGDHYPVPTWAVNMGTADQGITDFGNIAMVNENMAVTVIGRIVDRSTPPNPIPGTFIRTKGIYGLALQEEDKNNDLGMSCTGVDVASATSDTDGYFTLYNVQPNFVDLKPGTNDVDDNVMAWTQPRGSIQSFLIDPPGGLNVQNVHIEGNITDIYSGEPVADAPVKVGVLYPISKRLRTNNITLLPDTVTDANGHYVYDGDINNLPAYFYYYEHLPDNNLDDYITDGAAHIAWDDGPPRTITLLEPIVVGDPITPFVFVSSKTVIPPALGAYEIGHTYETTGNEYIIVSDATNITNADITLIREYRVNLFGRVIDDEGNGLEGSRILVQIYDGSSWSYHYEYYGGSYYTDSEGYWGDWDPAGYPGRGTEEFNLPLPSGPRNGSNPGAPYWYISVRGYPPSGFQSTASYVRFNIYSKYTSPSGWSNGQEVTWEDGMAVKAGPITLPTYYSEGM